MTTPSGVSATDAWERAAADERIDVLRRHGEPAHFIWHGRLYRVREVIAHWVQFGPGEVPPVLFRPEWATLSSHATAAQRAQTAVLGRDKEFERELWSVRAGVANSGGDGIADGVFQLCHELPDSAWILVGDTVAVDTVAVGGVRESGESGN